MGQILIVDDHELVRQGLRALLASRPDWTICGEATDGVDGIEKAKALRPTVVLMDISMPRMDGLEATRIIRKELPQSRVILISQNDPEVSRRQAGEVDATTFVSKSTLAHDLIPAIDTVLRGLSEDQKEASAGSLSWLSGGGEPARCGGAWNLRVLWRRPVEKILAGQNPTQLLDVIDIVRRHVTAQGLHG